MASVRELTQRLSAQANAVRTSVGTTRYSGAVAALQQTLSTVSGILQRGRLESISEADWAALTDMYQRASHTIRAEGVGASAEEWSDIITARTHAARTTPNQTTLGALMEAVDRAQQLDPGQASQLEQEELEDAITEARAVIQELSSGGGVIVDKDSSGQPSGIQPNTLFNQASNLLWPTDKPVYFRPGFLLGAAVGVGVLASWQKPRIKKVVKKLKK